MKIDKEKLLSLNNIEKARALKNIALGIIKYEENNNEK